ncbi:MAG: hypothetical protein ACI9SP_004201 [Arenicella sp.]|jgi:hypothetical protein
MNEAQSLFNPRDDSLAEKVDDYYSVCWDYSRAQSSLKLTGQGKNIDYIGDHSEVIPAYETISHSLSQASREVSSADLQDAKERGIINENQLLEIVRTQDH